jgi:hypothetical protein
VVRAMNAVSRYERSPVSWVASNCAHSFFDFLFNQRRELIDSPLSEELIQRGIAETMQFVRGSREDRV